MSAAPLLTISKDGEAVKSVSVENEAVVGRGEGCLIRLDDRAISRNHAVFRRTKDGLEVRKNSEFAPLSVNGAECTRALVKEGDVISIGPYLARVSMPKDVPAPAPAARAAAPGPASARGGQIHGTEAPVQTGSLDIPQAAPMPDLDQPTSAAADDAAMADINLEMIEDPAAGHAASGDGSEDPGGAGGDAQARMLGEHDFDHGAHDAPGGDASAPLAPPEDFEIIDEDAKTKVNAITKLAVKLVFAPGAANVSELELVKDEIFLGRGKGCDVVLNDKKCSRKNTVIRRAGLNFSIKDLESANGTYVNDLKVKEQELVDGDVVRIGSAVFTFQAMSADYGERQKDFIEPPVEEQESQGSGPSAGELEVLQSLDGVALPSVSSLGADMSAQIGMTGMASGDAMGMPGDQGADGAIPGVGGAGGMGITGIGQENSANNKSLLSKLRAMPKRRQYIIIGLVILVVYMAFEDEETPIPIARPKTKIVKKADGAGQPAGAATYDALSPENRKFVDQQYEMALNFFRNQDYDQTISTVDRIFKILPGYEQARELERYAREQKRKLDAQLEERRKREDEAKLKARIQALVDETGQKMAAKEYDVAKELFGQVLALDPDNQLISQWRKEIEADEEKRRQEQQARDVDTQINHRAREVFAGGMALEKKGQYYAAIDVFAKVPEVGASDKSIAARAAAQIRACRQAIAARRQPFLDQGKAAEDAGELMKAITLYRQAIAADPGFPAGYAGVDRIKGVLHDRAKVHYTEAILAESYSDFTTAKRKFKETLDACPEDDIYHQRAARKLQRYFRRPADDGGAH